MSVQIAAKWLGSAEESAVVGESGAFSADFNLRPFSFQHRLRNDPRFDVERLAVVAERIVKHGDPNNFVVMDGSGAQAQTQFSDMPLQERLTQTIRNIGRSGSWLKLTSADKADDDYALILQDILGELEALTGVPLVRDITWSALTVFVASPLIVTPYHIDHESNFLFQISGEKDVHLFDGRDRSILTEREVESFYGHNGQAAKFRDDLRTRNVRFHLAPGDAVHHPPLAPHWVQNGDNVSVSVSIGFGLRQLDALAKVYQANNLLRRIGLRPRPPGTSRFTDRLKYGAMTRLSKARPQSREEELFSGYDRVIAPARFVVKRLLRR